MADDIGSGRKTATLVGGIQDGVLSRNEPDIYFGHSDRSRHAPLISIALV